MDLLGDLGATDQLTSTRAENVTLKEKVKQLEERCKVLTIENQSLLAEVEMYRDEATTTSRPSGGGPAQVGGIKPASMDARTSSSSDDRDHFLKSGDGVYTKSREVLLENMNGHANILCCSLSNDDSVAATGGADSYVTLCQWGRAFDGDDSSTGSAASGGASGSACATVVQTAARIDCGAPVIAIDFDRKGYNTKILAAGCMDGTVHVILYEQVGTDLQAEEAAKGTIKHGKYVKALAWSPNGTILASASADGSVQLHKLTWDLMDSSSVALEKVKTLQLPGPVESLCFQKDHLCCYARGTPHLMYFDLNDGFAQQKINLNQGPGNAGFDEHVSFAVMGMSPHDGYLALATDTSRNIVIDWTTGHQIRNLYGHQNDGYSQPKVAWSKNGQYLYGNDQEQSVVCVWDIATSSIVDRLHGHTNYVRDMYSSSSTDTLVTTSFDKTTQFWLASTD